MKEAVKIGGGWEGAREGMRLELRGGAVGRAAEHAGKGKGGQTGERLGRERVAMWHHE